MSGHDQIKKESHEIPTNRVTKKCESLKKTSEAFVWLLGVVAIVFAVAWYVLGPRVDDAAKKVVLSPEVLDEISSRLRPYAVIDARLNNSSATFEYDDGGAFSDVVDSVDFRQGDQKFIGILTFKMKKFVRLLLVRPLTAGIYVHSFWRTNKFDWVFEIRPSATTEPVGGAVTGGISDDLSDAKDCRFLVELLTK